MENLLHVGDISGEIVENFYPMYVESH